MPGKRLAFDKLNLEIVESLRRFSNYVSSITIDLEFVLPLFFTIKVFFTVFIFLIVL